MGSYRKLSLEQAGFQKGRGISEQILLGNELINWLDRGFRPNNAVIKLDMAKAFDCIDWQFLRAILLRFGFSAFFVSLVLNHLEGTHISILVNWVPSGFFKPTRRVKQGDHLSPLLFILATEGFSRDLKHQVSNGYISTFL